MVRVCLTGINMLFNFVVEFEYCVHIVLKEHKLCIYIEYKKKTDKRNIHNI